MRLKTNEYGQKPTCHKDYALEAVKQLLEANPWGWHIVKRHCQITITMLVLLFIFVNHRFRYWKKVIKAMEVFKHSEGTLNHTHKVWTDRIKRVEYQPILTFTEANARIIKMIEHPEEHKNVKKV